MALNEPSKQTINNVECAYVECMAASTYQQHGDQSTIAIESETYFPSTSDPIVVVAIVFAFVDVVFDARQAIMAPRPLLFKRINVLELHWEGTQWVWKVS